ncbi:phage head closure protein [Sphingobium boeckii]|uniref:SPP1 family predicted phage head-tail adaptor n=1 Tax=Sphingobium boeckii TaxID=1082345 RepID=A0A7W9AEN3_9SPHN|nr:phage head closure protein [Sphingobium boeckii]MBB5684295.1 SPP1 family predicted phage head-tail adaptor [Sphingobium boeckii]
MPAAGDLTELLTLEQLTSANNGQGGQVTSWLVEEPKLWGKVVGLSGDEALAAGVQRSVQQWRVTIRTRAGLTTKHRFRWGARLLDIKAVMPDPKDRAAMLCLCESGLLV